MNNYKNRKMMIDWRGMVTKDMLGMTKERKSLEVTLSILFYIVTIYWEKGDRRARFRRKTVLIFFLLETRYFGDIAKRPLEITACSSE